jgi:hypothetical protein
MKTFTTLKLAVATFGMASLACGTMNGQVLEKAKEAQLLSGITSVLNKDFLSSLPLNLDQEIPKEILPLFKKENTANIMASNESFMNFLQKVLSPLRDHEVSVKVTVFDETGKKIENASAWLLQIRGFTKSQDLKGHDISDSFVPYKIKKKTDVNGDCHFTKIDGLNALMLAYHLWGGALPQNNLQLTVKAEGYSTTKQEFLNVDKKTLAFATYLLAAIANARESLPKEKQPPKVAAKITIPQENLGEVIEIKVVLKKEKPKPTEGSTENKNNNPNSQQHPVTPPTKK